MTKIKDLIATLNSRNPDAQVFLMTTRKQPFENHLVGVVGREEMLDQRWREEPGIASDDVFLVVGRRVRPGSLSAWIVAEHRATAADADVDPSAVSDDAGAGTTLAEIACEHLGIDRLGDAHMESIEFYCTGADVRRALEAAYITGTRSRGGASHAEVAPVDDATDPLQTHSG